MSLDLSYSPFLSCQLLLKKYFSLQGKCFTSLYSSSSEYFPLRRTMPINYFTRLRLVQYLIYASEISSVFNLMSSNRPTIPTLKRFYFTNTNNIPTLKCFYSFRLDRIFFCVGLCQENIRLRLVQYLIYARAISSVFNLN